MTIYKLKLSDNCRSRILIVNKDIRLKMDLKNEDILRIEFDNIKNRIIIFKPDITDIIKKGDKKLRKNNTLLIPKLYLKNLGINYHLKGYIIEKRLYLESIQTTEKNKIEKIKSKLDVILFKRNLTYKKIATDLNINRNSILNMFSGRTKINYEILEQISNYLGIEIGYLILDLDYEYYKLIKELKEMNIKPEEIEAHYFNDKCLIRKKF